MDDLNTVRDRIAAKVYEKAFSTNMISEVDIRDFPKVTTPKANPNTWKDTGGNKYDTGKPPMALLDAPFLEGVASVLGFGANKYAAHNWRNGIAYSRLVSAAYRHLGAINAGEDIDPESGLSHAYHLGCCTMFLASMMHTRPDLDDRWKA
jgi:hypothetical protein